jgi:N-methylhydantoinase B
MIFYSETVLKKRIADIRDGSWSETNTIDGNEPVRITLKLTKRDDQLLFDFTGSDKQSKIGINLALHATFGWCFSALLPTLAYDIPKNHGLLRCMEVTAPPGTVVNVLYPGPVSLNTTSSGHTVRYLTKSVLMQMLATTDIWRSELMALNAGHRNLKHAGLNQSGKYCVFNLAHGALDGTGARFFADGVDSGGGNYMSCPNVEWFEANFPILYLFRRHVRDGAGPGKFRGGTGAETAYILHDAPEDAIKGVAYGVAGLTNSGQGIFGGYPGAPSIIVLSENTRVRDAMAANISPADLSGFEKEGRMLPCCDFSFGKNDVLYMRVAMGGGYGDPLEREPELVLRDVLAGIVSQEAAQHVYGVALSETRDEINFETTKELRSELWARRQGAGN